MKYVIGILAVIAISAYGYLIILFNRTELATKTIVIGLDTITLMYALTIALLVGAIFVLRRIKTNGILAITIFIIAMIPITSFSYLNLLGKVISYTKG